MGDVLIYIRRRWMSWRGPEDKFSNEFSGMIAHEKTVRVVDEYKCTYFPGSLGK